MLKTSMHRIIEIFSFASHQPQQRATLLRDCKMRNPTEAAIAKVEYISEICLFTSMLREMLHKASSGILHREREKTSTPAHPLPSSLSFLPWPCPSELACAGRTWKTQPMPFTPAPQQRLQCCTAQCSI